MALESNVLSTAVESGKAMGSAMKTEGKDEGMAELYKLNQVWFRMPPTLSLVSKRTITRCNFQQVSYNNPLLQQIASLIFNTGEFYVSGKTSFLVIQAGIDKSNPLLANFWQPYGTQTNATAVARARSTVHAYLGQGGIMNIFDEVTFVSASGTEVDRQQNKGLQLAHVKRNRMCQDWFNTSGEIEGYPGGPYQYNYDRRGWPGYVQNNNNGDAASPWLIPSRGTYGQDYSLEWINLASGFGNANAVSINSYGNTHPQGVNPSYGSVDVSFDPVYNATFNPNPGTAPYFIVPLSDVLGFFAPYMNALIPAAALAGGRVEMRFKSPSESLIATGAAFISNNGTNPFSTSTVASSNASTFLSCLQIYNIYFLLDSFQMNEGVLKRLNDVSAGNEGLSVMFDTWDWTQTPFLSRTGEAQVAQARSRIIRSFCVLRDITMQQDPFANSLASESAVNRPVAQTKNYNLTNTNGQGYQLLVNSYQAVLGSLYFPQQPLNTLEEYLMNSYYVFGKSYQDACDVSAVSLSEFMGARGVNMWDNVNNNYIAPISQYNTVAPNAIIFDGHNAQPDVRSYTSSYPNWCLNWGSATYGFLAERSQLLQLSGLPISNARLLRHRFVLNYDALSANGRLCDVFTEYTRVAKVFLGGRIVMRE